MRPGPFEREVAGLGFPTRVVFAGRLRQLPSTWRVIGAIRQILTKEDPDVILDWAPKTHIFGGIAAALGGMADRCMWWQHGIPHGHWLDRLATVLPTRAVLCCSRSAEVAQRALHPRRNTYVVYPGIDPPERVERSRLQRLKAMLGIPIDRLVVGTVGRLQPSKGHHEFLRSVAAVRRHGYNVHALVVGGNAFDLSPGYEAYLHRLAIELGLSGAVTFTGQVPRADAFIQAMDISVNASAEEPFGLAVLEAMALGVPVVSFAAGGPAEIIVSEHSGLLVPGGGEPELTKGLLRLSADAHLRGSLGRNGELRFRQQFTAEVMARRIEAALAN